jgi:hypothetical protein
MRVVMPSVRCSECALLWHRSTALRLEYQTTREVLRLTPQHDRAYVDRWTDLAGLSQRLEDAQRRQNIHQDHHRRS